MIDERLLDILACPSCKGRLVQMEEGKFLACRVCKVKFPVKEGIPVMLIDEALPIGSEENEE